MFDRTTIVALLLGLAVAGCARSRAEPWLVERIQIAASSVREHAVLGIDLAGLEAELSQALKDSRRFQVLAPDRAAPEVPPPLQCRLEIAYAREATAGAKSGPVQAQVGVVLELKRSGQFERLRASGAGTAERASGQPAARAAAFRTALRSALKAAVESQVLQLDALHKGEDALIADLSSADARVKDYALRALAERRSARALPALLERLKDEDPEIVLRAAGALAALRDPTTVPALIEAGERRDVSFLISLVEVIGQIGGRDAEAYLFMLASGHPEDAVRQAAEAALERVQKSRKQASRAGTE